MQAVSLRSVLGRMATAWKPCARKRSRSKSVQPPSGPTASRQRSAADASMVPAMEPLGVGIREQPHRASGNIVQLVFHQHLQPAVNRHLRKAGVASLLQAFYQQGPVAGRREHVRIEVLPLDASGVHQEDASDTDCRELRPQSFHHLGAGKCQ